MRNLFIATMLVFSVVGCHEDDCDEAVIAEEEVAEEESEAIAQAIRSVIEKGDSSHNRSVQSWVQREMSWESIAAVLKGIYREYSQV